ncbi:NADAR family protein [Amycolatopsis magusensis]|uniref:NADAR family protein n=1 Tax=Amycolatopsis magusensis TaxID=882444 RepID=UPI003C2E2DA4
MTVLSREELVAAVESGERFEYFCFWGHTPGSGEVGKWCLSQWWPVLFTVDGVEYRSAEQYMMAEKARLFGDTEAEQRILGSETPAEAKELGRAVRDFDQDTWVARRFDIVLRGNEAKFGQHAPLREFLVATGAQVLVEAAPRDVIWGIGLGASNPRALDPAQWRGRNLLGFALMAVRDRLRAA